MLYYVRKLRPLIPIDAEYKVRRGLCSVLPGNRGPIDNLYHCCAWKTGSQWMRLILTDPRFYMLSGLKPIMVHDPEDLEARPEAYDFAKGNVVTNMFISHEAFARIAKPGNWRAFFVLRHPQEMLVSWYISNRYSHRPNPTVDAMRADMAGMSEEEGMLYMLDHEEFGFIVRQLEGWSRAAAQDPTRVVLARFEDLTGPDRVAEWTSLLGRLGFDAPLRKVQPIVDFYDVKKLKPPKKVSGESAKFDKYAGADARRTEDYLTPRVIEAFNARYPTLMADLGYTA